MMEPKFKPARRDKAWKTTEKRVASELGAKRHAMSGAHPNLKADSSSDDLLIENKSTSKKSMSIKQKWLEDLTSHALMQGRTPALAVTFENIGMEARYGEGKARLPLIEQTERDWIMVPLSFFKQLIGVEDK